MMSAPRRERVSDQLLQRVYGEFLEMPGLRLTPRQAQRLWGLDERTCRQLLEYLVDAKFLCRAMQGMYARSSEGRPSAAARPGADAPRGRDPRPLHRS